MSLDVEKTREDELGTEQAYRSLSSAAVVSGALGLLSVVSFLDWAMGLFAILGILTGLIALKRIRESPTDLTGEGLALAGILLSGFFLVAGWSRLAYVHATEVPEGYERISYDDLQPDESSPGQIVPPAALDLDKKKVFIKGYVYPPPSGQRSGITTFMLVRDKGDCCFGGSPKITDMILVQLEDSLELEFSLQVRRLAGIFHVEPGNAVDGLGGIIYRLDADYLK